MICTRCVLKCVHILISDSAKAIHTEQVGKFDSPYRQYSIWSRNHVYRLNMQMWIFALLPVQFTKLSRCQRQGASTE